MKDSGIFGSPRNDIIIGVALILTGILAALTPLVGILLGLAIGGFGIAVLGRQKGWWGDSMARIASSVSGQERGPDISGEARQPSIPAVPISVSSQNAKAMKIAAMVVGMLGSVVTFFVSIFTLLASSVLSAFTGEGIFVAIGWLVVLSSIGALAGTILTNGNPRLGAILLGIAEVTNVLFTTSGVRLVFGLGALLLVIAAVLAFIASMQERP